MTFQSLILKLSEFWASRGCTLQQPLDVEVGAGTMHPETFLRVLGPAHWNVAYVQPSRRPADGRFGENPNRSFKHHQFQVILKPAPDDVQQLYLESLEACGINPAPARHPVRGGQLGVADAGRLGHRLAGAVRRDGDLAVHLLPAGRRPRAGAHLRRTDLRSRADRDGPAARRQHVRPRVGAGRDVSRTCGFARKSSSRSTCSDRSTCRRPNSARSTAISSIATISSRETLLRTGLIWPALEHCLKCSHLFNVLDASNSIGVTERTAYILRVRQLAVGIAKAYVADTTREGGPRTLR